MLQSYIYRISKLEAISDHLINYTAEFSTDPRAIREAIAGAGDAVGHVLEGTGQAVGHIISGIGQSASNLVSGLLSGPFQVVVNVIIVIGIIVIGCVLLYCFGPVIFKKIKEFKQQMVRIQLRRPMTANDNQDKAEELEMETLAKPRGLQGSLGEIKFATGKSNAKRTSAEDIPFIEDSRGNEINDSYQFHYHG